ncbi:MAG: transglycosylase SLT domain-containing protein [Rhodanobacter sp.]
MIAGLILILLGLIWVFLALVPTPTPTGWPLRCGKGLFGLLWIALGMLLISLNAHASSEIPTPTHGRVSLHVPDVSAHYRLLVEQAAVDEWGVDASPARLAAQLHQESSWNPQARSAVGAQGLAQFMPSTGRWLAQRFPQLGAYDPWDPSWSAHAAAVYDHWLLTRNPGRGSCSNWAFAVSAYNGGEPALHREQALAGRYGHDSQRWFGNVADMRSRTPAAWRENRGYVRRILIVLEPAYIDAGWPGRAVCV